MDSVPSPSQSLCPLSTIDKELPAWLFYTDELYTLHLSAISVSDLAAAARCCSQISDDGKSTHAKSLYISKIVSHFVSQRARLISLSTVKGVSYIAFVAFMEKTYGSTVAASLREPPFVLTSVINRNCHPSLLVWFNESIEDLVYRLRSIKLQSLLDSIKRIPAYRRPTYDRSSHRKTANIFVDHLLRRLSYLFSLTSSELYEITLALHCYVTSELDTSSEVLIESIIRYEYSNMLIDAISTPVMDRSEHLKLERRNEKQAKVQAQK